MKKNIFDIEGKVILITGGYGILGSQMAEYLASQGAKVVVLGRSKEKGEALVNKIKTSGDEAVFYISDALDKANLEQNREDTLQKYGKIDILINAAGGNMPGA
ncbi:MAG: SDR family NAD(P)-dependent oxidoreductase, partial [Prevotella sp.]|nr:SDR family NAD(P)-dependent oxidoreductase [Prevotella sp.]